MRPAGHRAIAAGVVHRSDVGEATDRPTHRGAYATASSPIDPVKVPKDHRTAEHFYMVSDGHLVEKETVPEKSSAKIQPAFLDVVLRNFGFHFFHGRHELGDGAGGAVSDDGAGAVLHGIQTVFMIPSPEVSRAQFTQEVDSGIKVFSDGCRPIGGVWIPHGSGPESRKIYGVA
jgi:hypothetical protein